ncbi:hypothetical protein IU474_08640 [Nocardia otitidiscaviarum]|uniref:hypothetical protein n=1 Tax=Nocardia otitidiscaviarum TaxID=1823 RepID=UPI0018963BA0|nr:hypothetical protein [Nocardia otitidiscaviarum]MBF6237133.1 hypothetical protein [Nocardia otitidiscaviarum]
MEVGEEGQLLVGDPRCGRAALVVDVEALEEGVVEEAARFGVGDEIEGVAEDADADGRMCIANTILRLVADCGIRQRLGLR